jgi:NADPH-dependent 2,4-dienoyl-CoA reductase/sulfur reductase-like enzyme/nitrite reductase/ring-hydroxylating ferredoxin subunit
MSQDPAAIDGPDFGEGIDVASIGDGAMLAGQVGGEAALLVRQGDSFVVVGATCTHYGAPLADGLIVDGTIRCPWHHACFSLQNGRVLRAPALAPLPCWRTEQAGGKVYARERQESPSPDRDPRGPASIVIVGGGAAGHSAAETLRREGYAGPITMLSADASLPCDRPNLSKGYLAGTAPEDWMLLRPAEFFRDQGIEVRLNARVVHIDLDSRTVELADRSRYSYGALLLATGAEPVRLDVPGADLPHVRYLRTFADGRALLAKAQTARRAVVIGSGFIGLEVASSLRQRGIEVHVVGRGAIPMARILGPELGAFLRSLHEQHGVVFHLNADVGAIDAAGVTLVDGERIEADLVVVGIGVRPATALAEAAGLKTGDGVEVDRFLQTSAPGIFAAGDIARWPDPLSGESIRVEHFVVAERQGQTAARNMLGLQEPYEAVPFFWTEQYDLGLAYVGHAGSWDEAAIDGSIEARDCTVTYRAGGRDVAVAVIHRDRDGLCAELAFERAIAASRKPHAVATAAP